MARSLLSGKSLREAESLMFSEIDCISAETVPPWGATTSMHAVWTCMLTALLVHC